METYDIIKELAEKQKISIRRLEENLGFGNGTLNRWRTNTPGVDKLEKVADYFGVTTDYLLGREKKKLEKNVDLSDDTVIMTYQGKPLSPEDRELILRLMRGKE